MKARTKHWTADFGYLNQDIKTEPRAHTQLSLPPVAMELPALVTEGKRDLVAARCLFFLLRRA